MNRLAWIEESLERLERRGLRRHPATRQGPQQPALQLNNQELINFSSNDYLGLAARALPAETPNYRGSGASPLITGRSDLQLELQRQLAELKQAEDALLFSSGFAANVGVIGALVGKPDVILCDAKNHASIIDGCRLSGAEIRTYRHADLTHLSELLGAKPCGRRRLIVTDSLFSMDGDFAPLPGICELAERHQAMVMVDEAHATGVFGKRGGGVCELLGVQDAVDICVGTLSKALGGIGGFATGSHSLIQWLLNRARTYVFSTALPDVCVTLGLAGLSAVRDEPFLRQRVLDNAAYLRNGLTTQGWRLGPTQSQILPVLIGSPDETMQLAASLSQHGLAVPGIRPPSVPSGESLLRISVSAAHTRVELDRLLAALSALRSAASRVSPERLAPRQRDPKLQSDPKIQRDPKIQSE